MSTNQTGICNNMTHSFIELWSDDWQLIQINSKQHVTELSVNHDDVLICYHRVNFKVELSRYLRPMDRSCSNTRQVTEWSGPVVNNPPVDTEYEILRYLSVIETCPQQEHSSSSMQWRTAAMANLYYVSSYCCLSSRCSAHIMNVLIHDVIHARVMREARSAWPCAKLTSILTSQL